MFLPFETLCIKFVLVMKGVTDAVCFLSEHFLDESHCLSTYNVELITSTAFGPSSSADTIMAIMAAVPRSTTRQSARQRLDCILQGTLATFTTIDVKSGQTLFFLIVEMFMKVCLFSPAQDSVWINSSVLLRDAGSIRSWRMCHTQIIDHFARASWLGVRWCGDACSRNPSMRALLFDWFCCSANRLKVSSTVVGGARTTSRRPDQPDGVVLAEADSTRQTFVTDI